MEMSLEIRKNKYTTSVYTENNLARESSAYKKWVLMVALDFCISVYSPRTKVLGIYYTM